MVMYIDPFRFGALLPWAFVNLGAESGLSGWTTTTGTVSYGDGTSTGTGYSPAEGSAYFTINSTGAFEQTLAVPSANVGAVDAGRYSALLLVYSRSADSSQNFSLKLDCYDASASLIGTIDAPTGLRGTATLSWWRTVSIGALPSGTRTVVLRPYRQSGTTLICIDAMKAVLALDAVDIGFANLGAETASPTGWTTVTTGVQSILGGSGGFPAAVFGSRYLTANNGASAEANQTVTVDSGLHAEIDAGTLYAWLSWWQSSYDASGDSGSLSLEFFNGVGASLGSTLGSSSSHPREGFWEAPAYTGLVPAGTRSVKLVYRGTRTGGTSLDFYIDATTAKFYRLP